MNNTIWHPVFTHPVLYLSLLIYQIVFLPGHNPPPPELIILNITSTFSLFSLVPNTFSWFPGHTLTYLWWCYSSFCILRGPIILCLLCSAFSPFSKVLCLIPFACFLPACCLNRHERGWRGKTESLGFLLIVMWYFVHNIYGSNRNNNVHSSCWDMGETESCLISRPAFSKIT